MLRKLWQRRSSTEEVNSIEGLLPPLEQAIKNASPSEIKRHIVCTNLAHCAMCYRADGDMRTAFLDNENFRELEPDDSGAPRFDDLKSGLHAVVAKNFLELQVVHPDPVPVVPDFVVMVEQTLSHLGSRIGSITDCPIPHTREFRLSVFDTEETARVLVGPTETPFRTTTGGTLSGLFVTLLIEKPRTNESQGDS